MRMNAFHINHYFQFSVEKDFNELDKTYSQLDIDTEIKKLFSEYKINTTEDQAAFHHIYRSAYGEQVSNVNSITMK